MSSIKCAQCGLVNWASAEMCKRCGVELVNVNTETHTQWQPAYHEAGTSYELPGAAQEEYGMAYPAGPFDSVGAVVSPTIDVFKNNFWLVTKIVLVLFAPYEVVKVLQFNGKQLDWQLVAGTTILGIVCNTLVAPALIYSLVTVMRTGLAPGLTEAYRWGLSRLGRIILCVLLAWILELLGTICLIVPGIILSLAFILVIPLASLENEGAVETLKRSYHLTDGYKWRILGASIVIGLLAALCKVPLTVVGAMTHGALNLWPLDAVLAMLTDVISASSTVLSLMIYLSLTGHAGLAPECAQNPVTDTV